MKKSEPKSHSQRGYAVVTKSGRVQIDTICRDRESAENYLSMHDEEKGAKVRRITVTCEWR